jgi:arginyl-tRNA synthetase
VFLKIEAKEPGFINFWVTNDFLAKQVLIGYKNKNNFGKSGVGKKQTVIVEYSSPNIAKPMHVGHIRSTIIGDAIANVHQFLGYKVIRWNYLGDWGTQFGKLIAAYKKWGNKAEVQKNPIKTLLELYIRFHDEAKKDAGFDGLGQAEFKKLEEGDKENRKLWEWFKRESLREFNKTYKLLGIKFDQQVGESDFEKKLQPFIKKLFDDGVIRESEGSLVFFLDQFNLPPALVQKKDGASLYLTRDLLLLRYRLDKFKAKKIFYVVGNEQALHFEQLFAVAKVLDWKNFEAMHVKFGGLLDETGSKFATREGKLIPLDELITKLKNLALEVVGEKNPHLKESEKEEIASVVALGALKYNDLKENRNSNIVFDWKRMLDFSGQSAPYLQYSYARISGILKKEKAPRVADFGLLELEDELDIARKILEFPDVVLMASKNLVTSGLAQYLYDLASLINRFYERVPVLKEEDKKKRQARLALLSFAGEVLKNGLGLLGIRVLGKI